MKTEYEIEDTTILTHPRSHIYADDNHVATFYGDNHQAEAAAWVAWKQAQEEMLSKDIPVL